MTLRHVILTLLILLVSCQKETKKESFEQYVSVSSRCIELLPEISSEFERHSKGMIKIRDANEGRVQNSNVVKISIKDKKELPEYKVLLDYLDRKCNEQKFYSLTYGFDKDFLISDLSKIFNLIDLQSTKVNIRITSNKLEFWGQEDENPFENIDMSVMWSDQ